jgi:hypothetical protein
MNRAAIPSGIAARLVDHELNGSLSKFICHPKPASWVFPFDVVGFAHNAAAAAFDAALIGDLDIAIRLQAVRTDRAEVEAALPHTLVADFLVSDLQMRFFFIHVEFNRHQNVIDKNRGQAFTNLGGVFLLQIFFICHNLPS